MNELALALDAGRFMFDTFASHQRSHNVVYQTARTDLIDLGERGVLEKRKKVRQMVFVAPADLSARLMQMEKEVGA